MGVAFIGFAVGWVFCRHGGRLARIGKWVVGLAVAFLWLMSCHVTTRIVGVGLESGWSKDGVMHGSIEGLPDAEAIIVLGGGVGAHAECHAPELYSGTDRLWQGARLYNAKKSRVAGLKVYCTGGGCEYAAIPFLTDLGVPREAIWFSEEPRNTEEESKLIKKQLSGDRPRIYLVTSAWHMARAKMLFDRAGFEVIPVPTDFEMSCAGERSLEFGDFIPSADALLRNSCAVKEWIGRLGYAALRR